MRPKISVVVPIYNVEKYIGECAQSLLEQTFEDFEVVCVDDGSQDRSLDILRTLVKDDTRFSFYHQENAGMSAAKNRGLELARGEYVVFLDSDDRYEPQALEMLYTQAASNDLDVLFFSAKTIYEDARVRSTYRDEYLQRKDIEGVLSGQDLLVAFVERDSYVPSAAMQLTRKSFLDESGITYYVGIRQEDNLFTGLVLAHAKRAGFLNEPLYIRRVRAGSTMTSKKSVANVEGHFVSGYELSQWLEQHYQDCSLEFRRAFVHVIANCFNLGTFDALKLDDSELQAYAQTLGDRQALSFYLQIMEHRREMRAVRSEYEESNSFRIGSALTAVPRWLKDRFS